VKQKQKAFDELKQQTDALAESEQVLKRQYAALCDDLRKQTRAFKSEQTELEKQKDVNAQLRATVERAQNTISTNTKQLAEKADSLTAAERKAAAFVETERALKSDYDDLKQQLEQFEGLKQQNQALEAILKKQKDEFAEIQRTLESQNAALGGDLAQLRGEVERTKSTEQKTAALAEAANLKKRNAFVATERSLQSKNAVLDDALKQQRIAFEQLQKKNQVFEREIQTDNTRLKAEVENAKKMIADITGQLTKQKTAFATNVQIATAYRDAVCKDLPPGWSVVNGTGGITTAKTRGKLPGRDLHEASSKLHKKVSLPSESCRFVNIRNYSNAKAYLPKTIPS